MHRFLINDFNPIIGLFNQLPEQLQGLFRTFRFGDVFVNTQDANHFLAAIAQGNLGRSHPDGFSFRSCLWFLVTDFGNSRVHDLPIIGKVALSIVLPPHIEIGLSDQLIRRSQAGILRKQGIAA